MIRFVTFLFCVVQLYAEHDESLINFPLTMRVNAGDDFKLVCKSKHGVLARISKLEEEEEANEDQLFIESLQYLEEQSDAITERKKCKNVNKKEHEGLYRCVVFHGSYQGQGSEAVPTYSTAECLVTVDEDSGPVTPSEGPGEISIGANHVCSVFAGGVVESFDGSGTHYDLSCTHVLAADLMTDGDYTNPWFIYGTFDQHDGATALMSMTFYVGTQAFEFQRGWLINLDGSQKMPLKEGDYYMVPNTGCYVVFQDKHLQLGCPYFEAYYDGIMSGHIRLKTLRSTRPFAKRTGTIGLCWDNQSGWRTNWQVGTTTGLCQISSTDSSCKSANPSCDQYRLEVPRAALGLGAWARCEAGPTRSCTEMNCGDRVASAAQECALQQAVRIMCSLKYSTPLQGSDGKCPADDCEWKKDVLARGCPQDHPPFVCA